MTPSACRFRVRYPETDRMGVAHHTHFFVWFELGRTELMRERGCTYADLEEQGVFFPVVEAGARYRRPARYDEELSVETSLEEVGGASVRFAYRIVRSAAGSPELLATGFSLHACIGRDGVPLRIRDDLRERLLGPGGRR